jgi:hypothetical protein
MEKPLSADGLAAFLCGRLAKITWKAMELLRRRGKAACIRAGCAEDVASGVVIKLTKKFGMPDFENAENWLHFMLACINKSVKHTVYEHLEKCPHSDSNIVSLSDEQRNGRGDTYTFEDVIVIENDDIQAVLEAKEKRCRFRQALKPKLQEVYDLITKNLDVTAREVKENTGCSHDTAKKRLAKVRNLARAEFCLETKTRSNIKKEEGEKTSAGNELIENKSDDSPVGGYYE